MRAVRIALNTRCRAGPTDARRGCHARRPSAACGSMTDSESHRDAVQAMFLQHHVRLRNFLTTLVVDASLVDDIVQETFVTVSQKAGGFTLGTDFRAWLWSVARLKTHEVLRAVKRQRVLEDDVIDLFYASPDAIDWEAHERRLRHVEECVEALAPKARRLVELRYQQAMLPPDISRAMGWTVNAVNVALSRARRAIRACVENRLAVRPLQ